MLSQLQVLYPFFLFALTFILLPSLLNIISINVNDSVLLYSNYVYWGLLANLIGVTPFMFNLGTGELRDNTFTSGVMAILCCVLAFGLGKYWQGNGVVIGWALSQIIANILLIIIFFKKENIKFTIFLRKDSLLLLFSNLLFITTYSIILKNVNFNIVLSIVFGIALYLFYMILNYLFLKEVQVLVDQLYMKFLSLFEVV